MTRSHSPGGHPTEDVAAYYRRRTEVGVGLIITEGTTIDHPSASMDPNIPDFHTPEALAGWKRVADEVHDAGGLDYAAALAHRLNAPRRHRPQPKPAHCRLRD